MKNVLSNVISFDNDGNVVLKGTLNKNTNPVPTADDEFIFKESGGSEVAIINLVTGNMAIKGGLFEKQPALNNPASNDIIIKNQNDEIVSYIDESGNLYLKGSLTENGNPWLNKN